MQQRRLLIGPAASQPGAETRPTLRCSHDTPRQTTTANTPHAHLPPLCPFFPFEKARTAAKCNRLPDPAVYAGQTCKQKIETSIFRSPFSSITTHNMREVISINGMYTRFPGQGRLRSPRGTQRTVHTPRLDGATVGGVFTNTTRHPKPDVSTGANKRSTERTTRRTGETTRTTRTSARTPLLGTIHTPCFRFG